MKINIKSKKLWWYLWYINLAFGLIDGILYVITGLPIAGISSVVSFLGMAASNYILSTLEDENEV